MSMDQGFRVAPTPTTLGARGVRLEPMGFAHEAGLEQAARDGELWNLRVTSVPEPGKTGAYIQQALDGLDVLLTRERRRQPGNLFVLRSDAPFQRVQPGLRIDRGAHREASFAAPSA